MSVGGWGVTRIKQVNGCHPERRHYARGLCKSCYRNTPAFKAQRQGYYQAHRDQYRQHDLKRRALRKPAEKRYGMPAAAQIAMLEAQAGLCAICGREPGRKGLCVDHDHATGRVRAMLCTRCNTAIGMLKDDPELCERAAIYLRNHTLSTEAAAARDPSGLSERAIRGGGLPPQVW